MFRMAVRPHIGQSSARTELGAANIKTLANTAAVFITGCHWRSKISNLKSEMRDLKSEI
jgi:hypothetical protein